MIRRFLFPYLHRTGHGVHFQPVVGHLGIEVGFQGINAEGIMTRMGELVKQIL